MTVIKDSKRGTDEASIARLEFALGHRFPEEYRAFLLAHNGGRPVPAGFQVGPAEESYSDAKVHDFYGVGNKLSNLVETIEIYEGRIPEPLIPIASDTCGNQIAIALTGERRGAIFFWDHEEETRTDPPGWANVTEVGASLNAFLAGLAKDL